MRIWGKLIGAGIGFLMGRWFGALLGAYLGHRLFDRRPRTNPFFHTTFAVMGHLAKSSGRVTEQDIALASALMDQIGLTGRARTAAQQAYRQGKASDYPLQAQLRLLASGLRFRRDLARMFLEIQVQAALVDGELTVKERQLLTLIAKELGFDEGELARIIRMWHGERAGQRAGMSDKDACEILGVSETDDLRTIKRAYRRLMAQHHPDKLASQGLPPEMASVARQKSQDIQNAWERLRASRG
ncbi:co-chaperone DjlA [Ferrimonas marina]|uniref:DnaJ like chaperone protein n=1 Tax=Ferrimonas marina TaxID=299255 RepID=A0A1M5ZL36_9GAMM|nr:co-chaperone DjlA [Ferrimonas marina]SHI24871.1 DnaJ like chaperone protein [Ferrimonas marina]